MIELKFCSLYHLYQFLWLMSISIGCTSETLHYSSSTFGPRFFTIPPNVDTITITSYGAYGGDGYLSSSLSSDNMDMKSNAAGFPGSSIRAILSVNEGEILTLYIGGAGHAATTTTVGSGGFGYHCQGEDGHSIDEYSGHGGGGGGMVKNRGPNVEEE